MSRATFARAALMGAFFFGLSPAAFAKSCELDLQIIFMNASQVAKSQTAVAVLDTMSFGLFSSTFETELKEQVYLYAQQSTLASLTEYGLGGWVKVMPAVLSGRAKGWTYWDPVTDALADWGAATDRIGSEQMLVVHLDDPKAAALAAGTSPATVGLGNLLGADIRGRVYNALIFEEMKPYLVDNKVQTVVNTGFGVKCKQVAQGY